MSQADIIVATIIGGVFFISFIWEICRWIKNKFSPKIKEPVPKQEEQIKKFNPISE